MKSENKLGNYASAIRRNTFIVNSVSLASQVFHLVTFELERPQMQFDAAMLIISIDVDVGSRQLGLINQGRNDANVHKFLSEYNVGEIEEQVIPYLVNLFEVFEIPVTFAVRGQLTELDDSMIMDKLLNSSVKHDIGAHGYYHKNFQALSKFEAEKELTLIAAGFKRFNINPRVLFSHETP